MSGKCQGISECLESGHRDVLRQSQRLGCRVCCRLGCSVWCRLGCNVCGVSTDVVACVWFQGCQNVIEDWQKLLQVRSLVFAPHDDLRTWLKYASLCRRNGRLVFISQHRLSTAFNIIIVIIITGSLYTSNTGHCTQSKSSSSSSLFGMHHQCVAPLPANSPHSGLSRAILIASLKVRLCRDRSFFRVAIQEEWGRPTGLLQSLWGTAVRILLASADSSILIRCPNSMSLLFCMIEVRRGCSVRIVLM